MAGFYPDVPGPRMPYDRDGTTGLRILPSVGTVSQLTALEMAALNDQSGSQVLGHDVNGLQRGICFIFPEQRDIVGCWVTKRQDSAFSITPNALQSSNDTTNGIDGTWTTVVTPWTAETTPSTAGATFPVSKPLMRTSILAAVAGPVRALRWLGTMVSGATLTDIWGTIHVYGEPSSGAILHRLRIWHPTLNQEVDPAHFDWGDVPRGSSATKDFRIKNDSATLVANSVSVSHEVVGSGTDNVGVVPVVPQFLLSDGGAFDASLLVGPLAPGAISGVLTVQRTTPVGADLGLWLTLRMVALAGSWT